MSPPKRDSKVVKRLLLNTIRRATKSNSVMSTIHNIKIRRKFEVIERLDEIVMEFNQKTCGFSISETESFLLNGEDRNDKLFQEYQKLEQEVCSQVLRA